eukprot:2577222-Pyramimonas_sp.AAC.1
MENVWGDMESRGCKLALEHPFLDGANEGRKRAAHGQAEAEAKPPAQPAGGSASSASRPRVLVILRNRSLRPQNSQTSYAADS